MGMNFLKRTKRIMRTFKLNEISAVDRPAQEDATVAIIKSHSPAEAIHAHCEKLAMDIAEKYPDRTPEQNAALTEAFEKFEDAVVGGISPLQHHASQVADMLVEVYGQVGMTRQKALDYLFHDNNGAALLKRRSVSKSDNKESKMDNLSKVEKWDVFQKSAGGFEAIAKRVVDDNDAHGLSEAELTDLLKRDCKRRKVDFVNAYDEHHKAFHIAKQTAWANYELEQNPLHPAVAKAHDDIAKTAITRDSLSSVNYDVAGVEEDMKRMVREILATAPWKTPREAYALVRAQLEAKAKILTAQTMRRGSSPGSLKPIKV
jgi:hypothetical protein